MEVSFQNEVFFFIFFSFLHKNYESRCSGDFVAYKLICLREKHIRHVETRMQSTEELKGTCDWLCGKLAVTAGIVYTTWPLSAINT